MKRKSIFAMLAVTFGLGMPFTSCTDNCFDVSNGGNGDDAEEEVNQAEVQKKLTLSCLLEAVAGVDSLPDNWNTSSYIVSSDSLSNFGIADDSDAGVRKIATRNVDEAYRKFASLTSMSTDGTTPETKTWESEGIGKMTFKQSADTTVAYATVDVDIQQMPSLKQIKFVPASLLGTNASFTGTPYYQFGDVILQTKDGEEPTYWICVRPASKAANDAKTHWCTFQLNSKDQNKSNYKKVTKRKYYDGYLPTDLGKSQADCERMVQNFFNVLRLIGNPNFYDNQKGIDDITKEEFEPYMLKAINYMWDDQGIWDKVKNKNYAGTKTLKQTFIQPNAVVNAFYYGYKGFSSYNVFNGEYKINTSNNNTLFNQVTYTTPSVELGINKEKNFSEFESGSANFYLNSEESETRGPGQFIVKYRTGKKLEGSIFDGNDTNPAKSFEETCSNNIKDVLVSRKLLDTKVSSSSSSSSKTSNTGFYAFGDLVTQTKTFTGTQFCIKETNTKASTINDEDKNYTYFICANDGQVNTDKGGEISGSIITLDVAKSILFHLMNAYVYNVTGAAAYDVSSSGTSSSSKNYVNTYHNLLQDLYSRFLTNKGLDFSKVENKTTTSKNNTSSNTTYTYTIVGRFYIEKDDVDDQTGQVTTPVTVTLTYDPTKKSEKSKGFSITYNNASTGKKDILLVNKYKDEYVYRETFSRTLTLNTTGTVRTTLKSNLSSTVAAFLSLDDIKKVTH